MTVGVLAARQAMAGNGTALYFTAVSPSGTGSPTYDMTNATSLYWASSENGTPGSWVSTDQATFGTNATDSHYPSGTSFSLEVDTPGDINGIIVNPEGTTITLYGTQNAHPTSSQTWWVTNSSTLIDNDTWAGGFNFNSQVLTLAGGGTFTFQTTVGNNDNTNIFQNDAGGVVNLDAGNDTARSFGGGYILNSGTLNFAAGAATAFGGLTNKLDASGGFVINGGTVDNTSGSAMTLTIGSRGCTFGGSFIFNGSSSLNFGSSAIVLTANPVITINANTLTLSGVISGSGFGLTEAGSGTLVLSGANTYTGNTLVTGGTLALVNSGSINSSANVGVNGATLDSSGLTLPSSTNPSFSLTNATLVMAIPQTATTNEVTTTLNLGGTTNIVNIVSLPAITSYPSRFPLISYSTLNGAFNIGLGTLPSSVTPFGGYITNINNMVTLVLTTGPAPARSLTWLGTDPSNPNNWDVQSSMNWETNGGPPTTYNQGDIVTFNDSAPGQTNIYLTTSLTPSILTVSNSVLVYNLGVGGAGSGEISGTTALTKEGTNVLILDDSGGNNFSGGLNITAGTVQVGLGDSHGSAGAGTITDNGALVFDDSMHDSGLLNDISGSGAITHEGGDTLQLAGTNSFSGSILVESNGTLQLGNQMAFAGAPAVTVSNGSTLDLNGYTAYGVITVQGVGSGNGALINSSATVPPGNIGMTNLTLTGDTTIGVTGSRFDLRNPAGTAGNPGTTVLSTGGQPYNLVKTGSGGTGVFGLIAASVDPALANIDIQQGDVQMAGTTTGLGNPTNTLSVESGATFEIYAETNLVNKVFVVNDGSTILNSSGVNTIIGPMNITNSGGNVDINFDINGTSLVLSNTLTGNGTIFTESGTNTLYINGNSPNFQGGIYMNTPSTVVVDGVLNTAAGITTRYPTAGLVVNGEVTGGEVGPSFPSMIAGSGNLNCLVDASAAVYPGNVNVIGTMTVNNLTLEGSAAITFDVTPTSNDLIVVTGTLNAGGTINVNPSGLIPVGTKVPIITYAGTMSGSFNVNGAGGYSFTIDTSTQGVVNLVVSGGPPVWNGGSSSDSDWSDPANWNGVTVAAGEPLYFNSIVRLINTNDITAFNTYSNITFFTNSGPYVMSGQPVTLVGNSIANNSTATQAFDLPMTITEPSTFNSGPGGLIIGDGLTNASTAANNFLTLTGTGILTNLLYNTSSPQPTPLGIVGANANWTLVDNSSSTPMTVAWDLQVSNGVFNFGNAGSAPNLTSLTLHNGPSDNQIGLLSGNTATFNMVNGSLTMNTLNTAQSVNSTSIVNVVGGTLNLGPIGSVAVDYFQGANGGNTNENSIINISGGIMSMGITAGAHTGPFYVASRGNGTLTMSGSGTLNCATIDVSRNAQGNTFSSVGVVNLNGGIVVATHVGTATASSQTGPASNGSTPSATFNFNGGILRAATSAANFYQGSTVAPVIPITSIVQAGGAIIDSSNFTIGVLEPLQHDSTLGATPDGGLTKQGSGTLTLGEANTYTGPTTVSAGTLYVNGSLVAATTVSVGASGTLGGTGTVSGNVTCSPGGTVAPGGVGAIGTLTVGGNASLGGAEMELNVTTSPSNDVLSAVGSITYGGTLTVSNLAGTVAAGQSFTLFKAASLNGSFSATNLPALGAGLGWNWNPATGTLSVVSTGSANPVITNFSFSGGNLTISGSNAQPGTYYLLTSTSLMTPLNQWTPISTNVISASPFTITGVNVVVHGDQQQYYILSNTNN